MSDAGRKIVKALDKTRAAFDATLDFLFDYSVVFVPLVVLTLLTLLTLLGLLLWATQPEVENAVTLDRVHWACTQSTREGVLVTKQGVPINYTSCTQWSYQP